jgi:hypothetical protein
VLPQLGHKWDIPILITLERGGLVLVGGVVVLSTVGWWAFVFILVLFLVNH